MSMSAAPPIYEEFPDHLLAQLPEDQLGHAPVHESDVVVITDDAFDTDALEGLTNPYTDEPYRFGIVLAAQGLTVLSDSLSALVGYVIGGVTNVDEYLALGNERAAIERCVFAERVATLVQRAFCDEAVASGDLVFDQFSASDVNQLYMDRAHPITMSVWPFVSIVPPVIAAHVYSPHTDSRRVFDDMGSIGTGTLVIDPLTEPGLLDSLASAGFNGLATLRA